MKYVCKCGAEFESKGRLRQHIAILTTDWPAVQCDKDHYDPTNQADVRWINVLGYRRLRGDDE